MSGMHCIPSQDSLSYPCFLLHTATSVDYISSQDSFSYTCFLLHTPISVDCVPSQDSTAYTCFFLSSPLHSVIRGLDMKSLSPKTCLLSMHLFFSGFPKVYMFPPIQSHLHRL